MKIKCRQDTLWFAIIEILIWMFIFSLWILSIYAILVQIININTYNKNHIVATNLAREQLELVRNIRDSNYVKIQKYNQLNPKQFDENEDDYSDVILISTWSYYKIENDFSSSSSFPILMEKIENDQFWQWEWELNNKMKNYRLCLDSENRYVYCDSTITTHIPTKFYKYIEVSEVRTKDYVGDNDVIENAMKIKSKVIWYIKWYHEYEINTIIADRKRL